MTLVFFLSESKNGGGYLEIEVDDNNGYRPVVGDIVELDEYIAAWYMGFTPEPGKWIGLEIIAGSLI